MKAVVDLTVRYPQMAAALEASNLEEDARRRFVEVLARHVDRADDLTSLARAMTTRIRFYADPDRFDVWLGLLDDLIFEVLVAEIDPDTPTAA